MLYFVRYLMLCRAVHFCEIFLRPYHCWLVNDDHGDRVHQLFARRKVILQGRRS